MPSIYLSSNPIQYPKLDETKFLTAVFSEEVEIVVKYPPLFLHTSFACIHVVAPGLYTWKHLSKYIVPLADWHPLTDREEATAIY